jgi:regulator of protease activity HflC (stomatin/prohibitin superfamily)
VANYCTSIELEAQELGIVRHKGKMVAILPPSTRQLFWQGINIEVVDLSFQAKLSPLQVQELVNGSPEIAQIAGTNIYAKNIPASHAGLLFLNEEFQSVLRALRVEVTDLRLQSIEVSGQDILSKDKVPLRLNLIAGIRVTDPLQAQANVIRRREETAATRSMLNTAKVMEDNPVALRLKELEVLERIAEKIDRIQVNGSLDSILTDLIKIDRAKE